MKLFKHFCKFTQNSAIFCPLFSLFFLALFTQTAHTANQHSLIDQKQAWLFEEHKKTSISPHFFKFQKSHFPLMLICVTLSNAISTGKIPSAPLVQVPLTACIIFSQFGVLLLTRRSKSRKVPALYFPVVLFRLFEGISKCRNRRPIRV